MSRKISSKALEYARKQFCLDIQMPWEKYCKSPDGKVYICKAEKQEWVPGQGARQFSKEDTFFRAIICMGQLFLLADESIYEWAVQEFTECSPQWFCSYDNLRKIDEKLKMHGRMIRDTHLYYLPAEDTMTMQTSPMVPVQWFEAPEILKWKETNRFHSAVCYWQHMPDMLAVAAMDKDCETVKVSDKDYDQNHMLGMAGVSGDGEYLWQIGIDVVEGSRMGGLATNLVMLMKEEVLRRGKIPFYGTSESHTISQSVAYHAGFMPAWAEVYVKKL